jgi:hypothetical protein
MFGRVQAFATIPGAMEYLMVARGVFKDSTASRKQPMEPEALKSPPSGGGPPGGRHTAPLSETEKAFVRSALHEYLAPYLRG